jgi:hypothetical protein
MLQLAKIVVIIIALVCSCRLQLLSPPGKGATKEMHCISFVWEGVLLALLVWHYLSSSGRINCKIPRTHTQTRKGAALALLERHGVCSYANCVNVPGTAHYCCPRLPWSSLPTKRGWVPFEKACSDPSSTCYIPCGLILDHTTTGVELTS